MKEEKKSRISGDPHDRIRDVLWVDYLSFAGERNKKNLFLLLIISV